MAYQTEEELIVQDIRRLSPIIGEKTTKKVRAAYLLGDELTRQRIQETIDAIKAAVFSRDEFDKIPVMEPPPFEVAMDGEMELGTVLYDKEGLYPLMLKREDFLTHIGVFGSSGSGKTNIVRWITKVLAKQDIPVLIFDFSKRNYRNMLSFPELKDKINIYTVGRRVSPFRFNPLKPPEGIPISQWAKEFAEIFDHAYWLLGGGKHIILKSLDKIYNEAHPGFPKIKDLKEHLEQYYKSTKSAREKNWLATAQRPLESLTFRDVGHIWDTEEGILPSEFFKKGKITILELDSLSTSDKTFTIEIILQWIRDWLLVSDKRDELVGVIAIEEAHHILNRDKSSRFGMETVVDLIFREVRELGMGLVYIDQHPSLISYPALGNTSTHIYMNLGLDTKASSDIMDAAHMLGLKTTEEIEFIRKLPIGHGFLVGRRLDFRDPFLVKFPLVKMDKTLLKDDVVKKVMGEKILEMYKKEKGKEGKLPVKIPEDAEKVLDMMHREEDIAAKAKGLDRSLWGVLKILGTGKGISSSEIQRRLGVSGTTFRKRAEDLVSRELINRKRVKLRKQYAYYYFLTGDGELVHVSKYGEVVNKENEKSLDELREMVVNDYSSKGWGLVREGDGLIFGKDGLRNYVVLKTSTLGYDVGKYVEKDEEDLFFVCSSKIVKRKVIQALARYSYEKDLNFAVFVADPKDVEENISMTLIEFVED
ncbi:MAG: DUF87 domain-containing protein [Candidatus Aenigmarchaeota archaeon]|nr:DUF87 domain-containing protein [Candidatus Aenigmarchaeota archaeon]